MLALDLIAEQRILQAIARGDFGDLPGAGRPLELDGDPLAPAETRAVFRILKNSGFVPLEVLELREIASLEAALPGLEGSDRTRTLLRLALLRTHLSANGARRVSSFR